MSVNKILESLLPHLEELLQSGIFVEDEIRTIVTKRRRLEHRLFANPPQLQDYLQAIEFELNLEQLRRCRKESLGIVSTSSDGEFGIANRIHGLYRRALKHFKGDVKLWYQYIRFCEQMNQENELSRVYGRALAIHPTETALWILAAKFEFDSKKDTAAARSIFQQGLKANPIDQCLWIEYYRMELLNVEKLYRRREVLGLEPEEDDEIVSDELLKFKVPKIVFNHSIQAIPEDIKFRLKFVEVSKLFNGTKELECIVYDSMKEDFTHSALYWDALAKRCWRTQLDDYTTQTEELYREGMEYMKDADEKKMLWGLFCEWILNHTHPQVNTLRELVSSSCNRQLITEDLGLLLVNKLLQLGSMEVVLSLVDTLLEALPDSFEVWKLKLQLVQARETKDTRSLSSLCRRAVKAMATTELKVCVYQYWVDCMLLRTQEVVPVLEEALADTKHESIMIRLMEWLYVTSGIKSVRKLFKRLRDVCPVPPCSVYLKYIHLENMEGTSPKRSIIEEGLSHYGDKSADIWLECIRTQLKKKAFEQVETLHWRAVKTINGRELLDKFSQRYDELLI